MGLLYLLVTLTIIALVHGSLLPLDRQDQVNPRIVGGEDASPFVASHIAFILVKYTSEDKNYVCSASVLSDNAILSAAHCFNKGDIEYVFVFVGDTRRGDSVPYRASAVFVNSNYDSSSFAHDVAVVFTESSFEPGTFRTVFLPGPRSFLEDRQIVSAAGFGTTSEDGNLATFLQTVDLEFQELSRCAERSSTSLQQILKPSLFICAATPGFPIAGGKDTCNGDSGGPLYTFEGDSMVVWGITSFGVGCARVGEPGYYANVRRYARQVRKLVKRGRTSGWNRYF